LSFSIALRLIVWTIVYFCTNWFRRLIFMDRQRIDVDVDGARSFPRALFSGVLQGFVPSPLFFSMFVNCLSERIRNLIFMLMTYKFICRGIGLIWLA
jgi:hypothetical protein